MPISNFGDERAARIVDFDLVILRVGRVDVICIQTVVILEAKRAHGLYFQRIGIIEIPFEEQVERRRGAFVFCLACALVITGIRVFGGADIATAAWIDATGEFGREQCLAVGTVGISELQLIDYVIKRISVVRLEVYAEVVSHVCLCRIVVDALIVAPRVVEVQIELRRTLVIRGIDLIVDKSRSRGAACPKLDAAAVGATFERNLQQAFVTLVGITCRGDARVLDTFDIFGLQHIDIAHGRGYAVNKYHRRPAVDAQRAIDGVGCEARQRQLLEQLDGGGGSRSLLRGRIDYHATIAHRRCRGRNGHCLECLDVRKVNLQIPDVLATLGYHDFGLPVSDGGNAECRGIFAGSVKRKRTVGIADGLECRGGLGTQFANGSHDGSRIVLGQDYAADLTCLRQGRHKQCHGKQFDGLIVHVSFFR